MIRNAIASQYSKALFNIEVSKGNLEKRLEIMENFLQFLKSNPTLNKFLKSPQISVEEKKAILKNLIQNKTDITFLNFLLYLIDKRRFTYLPEITKEFHNKVNESLGIWEAELVTAIPIEESVKEKLRNKLETHYHKKIQFKEKIDKKIIGGALLVVGNQMIDWRIKTRLKKLKESLLASEE